ncbi:MAG: hypothetical protein OXN84_19265 [Albidovulum sp.]|nr:hypothetical protein [Albidovulum sp.]
MFALAMQPMHGGAHDPGDCSDLVDATIEQHNMMLDLLDAYDVLKRSSEAHRHSSVVLEATETVMDEMLTAADLFKQLDVCMSIPVIIDNIERGT